ncbi:hypothetical protein CSUI_008554 [Cystoisospora suis]|uniref:Transmembrane protein n=1 Tax=Cystoisospora suis TaxID=483139 RepID=A0A2C6KMB0_9APIC|nr:hypothetical protein CSUI_008554 [Cystoisospora suis]
MFLERKMQRLFFNLGGLPSISFLCLLPFFSQLSFFLSFSLSFSFCLSLPPTRRRERENERQAVCDKRRSQR